MKSNWEVKDHQVFPKKNNPLDNPFYGYSKLKLSLTDGREATYFGLDVPPCVHVVALEEDETTYMVYQDRPNLICSGDSNVPVTLELPGGFANPEDLAGSAQEEINTEIGKAAGSLALLGSIWPSVGVSNERDYIFLGTDLSDTHGNKSEEATEQDMRIVSEKFGTLYDWLQRSQYPVSAQTLAAMSKVAVLL